MSLVNVMASPFADGNVPVPTVSRIYTNTAFSMNSGILGQPHNVDLGAVDDKKIIVAMCVLQGNSNNTWNPVLNGGGADYTFKSPTEVGDQCIAIWLEPTASGTVVLDMNCSSSLNGSMAVYKVLGWRGYNVITANSFSGADQSQWSFTDTNTLPKNCVLFGAWSTNEDGSGVNKFFNFGLGNKFYGDTGAADGGGTYETQTGTVSSKAITCTLQGKRPTANYLALASGNYKG
jgi:hypothetical protein